MFLPTSIQAKLQMKQNAKEKKSSIAPTCFITHSIWKKEANKTDTALDSSTHAES